MRHFTLENAAFLCYKRRVMARRKRGTFHIRQAPLSLGQRTRRILIWVGAALGALLLLLLAGYLYLLSWLQGTGAREFLTKQLQQRTAAAEVSIPENLSVDGNHITLPACTLRGGAHGLQELSIRKLHLEVKRLALLRRILQLNHFSVEEMQLVYQLPDKRSDSSAPAEPTRASASVASGSLFVRDMRVRSFESHYTDTTITAGDRSFSLNGYQLIALPRPEIDKNAWAIAIENGRIRTPFSWLRESGVKSATLLYRGNESQLTDCTVELAPGHLSAKAVYQPTNGLWKARVDVRQANVARLLNDDWRKRLLGELHGHLDTSGDTKRGEWEASGELRLENGVLEGLPFLSDLRLHGTTPYRTLQLEHANCRITYPYSEPEHGLQNAWLWDKIDVRSKGGDLLLRGRIIIGAQGQLSGALSIGVPAKLIAQLGLSKTALVQKLFNAPVEEKGYLWVRVNLSGTIQNPQEDLSVRLATVLPEALPVLADQAMGSLGTVINNLLPAQSSPKKTQPQPTPADHDDPEPDDEDTDEEEDADPAPSTPTDKVRGIINTGLDLLF